MKGSNMYQPGKWAWGLLPLGALWFCANQFSKIETIHTDLAAKATSTASKIVGAIPGLKTIGIDVAGRDVTISGEALDPESIEKTKIAIDREFGARLVKGGLTLAQARKPYTWSAARDDQKITLSGFVPDEALKKANVEAAAKAFPGAVVEDRQTIAYGAPAGFSALTGIAIPELARLSQGRFSIDDSKFCAEGTASTPGNFLELTARMRPVPQTTFALANCALMPPTVSPYLWGAQKAAASGVSLTGLVPSDAVRKQIVDAAAAAFPSTTITDLMKPALGAPANLAALAAAGLKDLSQMVSGQIELAGADLKLSGEGGGTYESCTALKSAGALKALTGFANATDGVICPPAPAPIAIQAEPPGPLALPPVQPARPAPAPAIAVAPAPVVPAAPPTPAELRAVKGAGELVISGLAPSEADRTELLAAARRAAPAGKLQDAGVSVRTNLQPAPDYKVLSGEGLGALGRLDTGELTVSGRRVEIRGTTSQPETKEAVDARLRGLSPGELQLGDVKILVRPYEITVQADKSGAVVSGYVPDTRTKSDILAALGNGPLQGNIRDELRVVPDAPANFAEAAKSVANSITRLDMGTARLSDETVTVQGMTCRELIKSEVETNIRSQKPQGFTGQADISLRQTGCLIDPPNTCQADLDRVTTSNSILFQQSKADLDASPVTEKALDEVAQIMKLCPAAAIRIEGHTNLDGERFGYDNQRLSENRARMVQNALAARGIASGRLGTTGFGSRNPLLPHNTQEGREKNRRVQFTVAKP